jgi:hypothetical protein
MALKSNIGSECVAKNVKKSLEIWLETRKKIVHGCACHPQSQGSMERAKDIKSMLSM